MSDKLDDIRARWTRDSRPVQPTEAERGRLTARAPLDVWYLLCQVDYLKSVLRDVAESEASWEPHGRYAEVEIDAAVWTFLQRHHRLASEEQA